MYANENPRQLRKPDHVHDLDTAMQAYWSATTTREDTAAYHQILLFGGVDGYPDYGKTRTTIARWLRKAALWVAGPDARAQTGRDKNGALG